MPIQFRIKELQALRERQTGHRSSYREIEAATGLAKSAVSLLAQQKQKQVALATIDKLCEFFDCQVGDLMVRVKDRE